MKTVAYPITIFYGASCSLCQREITLLKKYDALEKIQLVDCSPTNFSGEDGFSRDAMMKLIHARDAAGQWMVGAPVFAAAYQATGFMAIGKIWGAAALQPIWRIVYPWIANNRRLLSTLGAANMLAWVMHCTFKRSLKRASAKALNNSKACVNNRCEIR
jgi:predicted DCC family thiol-disulfide oxidoreductase YuxK